MKSSLSEIQIEMLRYIITNDLVQMIRYIRLHTVKKCFFKKRGSSLL